MTASDSLPALPQPWRPPDAPADAPAEPLPFIGATPAVHRTLLVHAPAIAGLTLALLQDEPALAHALLDVTWAPDDPTTPAQQARLRELAEWLARTVAVTDASVDETAEWRDRVLEFGDLAMPMLPLLFTPDLIEAELGMAPDLGAAGALRQLTALAKTAPQPIPLLAPVILAALIGDRVAGDIADQLAMPGTDDRQFLRRLQERYDGWEAPTWADIIRVTFAAWREAAPWRRLLLHAQLDRLRAFEAMTPAAQVAGEALQLATDELQDRVALLQNALAESQAQLTALQQQQQQQQ